MDLEHGAGLFAFAGLLDIRSGITFEIRLASGGRGRKMLDKKYNRISSSERLGSRRLRSEHLVGLWTS